MDDTERWVPLEFERYITLLEKIQREPNWKTTRQLAKELNDECFDTSLRQVQRILEYFGPRFGVIAKRLPYGRGKPQAWAWPKQGKSLPFPTMDAPAALTYQIAAELLAPLLPTAFLDELEPEFKRAHRVLGLASTRAASLPRKLQVLPRGTGRLPAQIRPQVLHAVEHCLLHGQQLRLRGRLFGRRHDVLERLLHPIALVFRFDTMYLVAGLEDAIGYCIDWFALHRADHAECIDKPAIPPAAYDLDRTLKEVRRHRLPAGLFDESDRPARLHARILHPDALDSLEERPFSTDQTIHHTAEGWMLEATVTVTRDLLTELHDLGAHLEVLEPAPVRDHLARLATKLHQIYRTPASDMRNPE